MVHEQGPSAPEGSQVIEGPRVGNIWDALVPEFA